LDAVVINSDNVPPRDISRVWFNDGLGNFTDTNQSLLISFPQDVAFGDVYGDGDLDAYVANGYYGAPDMVFFNDGAGHLADSGQSVDLGTTMRVALGDLDGDGDLDVLTPNLGGIVLARNDGTGHF